MCGRFTRSRLTEDWAGLYGAVLPALPPSWNVAPTQTVAAIRQQGGASEGALLRWGLIPSWAKDRKRPLINARGETVATSPTFRAAFKRRRCLVLADGYFEWKAAGKQKQPYLFRLAGGQPFAFAGLWEHWEGDGEPLETCTVITTDANAVSRPVHDRMPVILTPDAGRLWLDPDVEDADALLALVQPYPADAMEAIAVSPLVNSAKNNGPELIRPLPA